MVKSKGVNSELLFSGQATGFVRLIQYKTQAYMFLYALYGSISTPKVLKNYPDVKNEEEDTKIGYGKQSYSMYIQSLSHN